MGIENDMFYEQKERFQIELEIKHSEVSLIPWECSCGTQWNSFIKVWSILQECSRQRGNFRCLEGRWQIIWRMINIRRMMSIWQYLEGSVDIQWIADIQFSTQKSIFQWHGFGQKRPLFSSLNKYCSKM